MFTASSTRSRTMDSTSRPTYPTSVYFEASTLIKGASASLASLLEISVFPTPVGPIIRIFLGRTSSLSSSDRSCRLHRLRSAMATIRLAFFCPTMYLSNSSTIWRGMRLFIFSCASLVSSIFFLAFQLLHHDLLIGIDIETGCNLHRLPDQLRGLQR